MISPLFTTIVLVGAFIWLYMKITTPKAGLNKESFMDRERKANSVRKQSLDDLNYITVPVDTLPFSDTPANDLIAEYQKIVRNLADCKVVNLTGITNTELKMNYGPANLTLLTEYDQNFTNLARAVYEWGHALYSIEDTENAKTVLEYGISIGSDISGNYLDLADIYISSNRQDKLTMLTTALEKTRSISKTSTLRKIEERIKASKERLSSLENITSDDSILPADILDILDSVSDKSDGQKQ